jgi:uncharacterized Zn finger protein
MPAKPGLTPDDGWTIPKRGGIGDHWWTLDALGQIEMIVSPSRLASARTYARQGRVTDVTMGRGGAVARVRGSRRHPYHVTIIWPEWKGEPLRRLERRLVQDRALLADLLAGDLPGAFAGLLQDIGLTLVPQVVVVERYWRKLDLRCDCTCPDWNDPCKHAVALLLVLLHRWDRLPGHLLHVRGLDLARLGLQGVVAEPDQEEPGSFYRAGPGLATVSIAVSRSPDPAAILRAMGPLSLQVGKKPVASALIEAYDILSAGAAVWGRDLIGDSASRD